MLNLLAMTRRALFIRTLCLQHAIRKNFDLKLSRPWNAVLFPLKNCAPIFTKRTGCLRKAAEVGNHVFVSHADILSIVVDRCQPVLTP